MKTVVIQSYRTDGVPEWMQHSMASVRHWAAVKGFDYRFLGDELFEAVPDDLRAKIGDDKLPLSDIARLEWARRLLSEGASQVVWVDADVLIFDPEPAVIPALNGYAFCREIWLHVHFGRVELTTKVNNAVSVFQAGTPMLDFYLDACRRLVIDATPPIASTALGTDFLSALRRGVPYETLDWVGLFSPWLLEDVAKGGGFYSKAYMKAFGRPLAAANLTGSSARTFGVKEETFAEAVRQLATTKGDCLNRFLAQATA